MGCVEVFLWGDGVFTLSFVLEGRRFKRGNAWVKSVHGSENDAKLAWEGCFFRFE